MKKIVLYFTAYEWEELNQWWQRKNEVHFDGAIIAWLKAKLEEATRKEKHD